MSDDPKQIIEVNVGGDVSGTLLVARTIHHTIIERVESFTADLNSDLAELMQQAGISFDDLQENEKFKTALLQASVMASRTHQREKLEALRNVVLNSALPNSPDDTRQMIFLRLIDELTEWHLRILAFFHHPERWLNQHDKEKPAYHTAAPVNLLIYAFPELEAERDLYDQLWSELFARGLVSLQSPHTTMSGSNIFASQTTRLGKQFIGFITSPLDDD